MSALLDIQAITCRYDDKVIFSDLSFQVAAGSIACLLGPSGCGKTTALRAIAGFEPVYSGTITLDGRILGSTRVSLPPEQREVGMVFQDYALFPHLTVAANIGFGLHKLSRDARKRKTGELLELIRLQGSAEAYPHQLSGGQQQRVALARALAPQPKLLLLDEPFSNLDTELRRSLSLEVREILRRHGTTAILVTHDQTEAFNVADEISVMAAGKLLQWGSARELYHQPNCPFVAAFLSNGSFLSGEVLDASRVITALGEVSLPDSSDIPPPGTRVELLLRPWNVVLAPQGPINARLDSRQFQGAWTLSTLSLSNGTQLTSFDEQLAALPPGAPVSLRLLAQHLRIFPAQAALDR